MSSFFTQYFYATFEALVDKNDTIQAVTKLHYLQTMLTGKAKEFIQQFEMTADSYINILKVFKERFFSKQTTNNPASRQRIIQFSGL